jgi:hypothetical protein
LKEVQENIDLEKLNQYDEHFERFIDEYDDESPDLNKLIEKEMKLSIINGRKVVEKTKNNNDLEVKINNKIKDKKPKTIKSSKSKIN